MSKKEIDPFGGRPLCGAPTKQGGKCTKHALKNSSRCSSHGGATPGAILAANTRAMMLADPLMAKLHAIAFDDTQPPAVQLEAIKQGLLHAGFGATKRIEIDAVLSDKRSFEDVTADVIMDLDMSDLDIVDAEVIEDDDAYTPLVPRDSDGVPPALTRGDRNFEAVIERGRRAEVQRMRSGGMSDTERKRREAEAFAETATVKLTDSRGRAAYLAALDAGATHPDAERAGRTAVEGAENSGKRRTRVTKATISDGRGEGRRR